MHSPFVPTVPHRLQKIALCVRWGARCREARGMLEWGVTLVLEKAEEELGARCPGRVWGDHRDLRALVKLRIHSYLSSQSSHWRFETFHPRLLTRSAAL